MIRCLTPLPIGIPLDPRPTPTVDFQGSAGLKNQPTVSWVLKTHETVQWIFTKVRDLGKLPAKELFRRKSPGKKFW